MKLPKCSSTKSWTDYGYEYDCNAIHEVTCDDCLCGYKQNGGLWNPKTGKAMNPFLARLLFGKPSYEFVFNTTEEL